MLIFRKKSQLKIYQIFILSNFDFAHMSNTFLDNNMSIDNSKT